MQNNDTDQVGGILNLTFWFAWGLLSILVGAGVGVGLGAVNQAQGTTLTVVTGMGIILGMRWVAQWVVTWLKAPIGEGWQTIAVKAGFLVGAVNLTVAVVLIGVTLWRVLWPDQAWAWLGIGGGLGAIAALPGGLITGAVLSQPAAP